MRIIPLGIGYTTGVANFSFFDKYLVTALLYVYFSFVCLNFISYDILKLGVITLDCT